MTAIDKKNYQLKKELMRLAIDNSFLSSLGLFINIMILFTIFWDIGNHLFLIVWSTTLTILLIVRSIGAKLFLKNRLKFSIEVSGIFFKSITLLSATILSLGFVILFPEDLPLYQSFLTMIVAGISAGSIMSLSYYKHLIVAYLSILLLPFSTIVYMQNTQLHIFIALLIVIFLLMLLFFSRRYYTNITQVIVSKLIIKQAQKELKLHEKNFSSIFKEVPIGIFTYNKELIIQEANQAFSQLLKADATQLLDFDMKSIKDKTIMPTLTTILQAQKGFYEGCYHTKISNEDIWISMKTVPMFDIENNVKGGLGIVEDITKRIETEKKMRYQAFYDHLTGLANRLTLHSHLTEQLERLKIKERFGAILFIDIDYFKNINDSLGHHIGDIILQTFASRASLLVSDNDIVARLGGDEFVILLSDLSDDATIAHHRTQKIADKLHKDMKIPIAIEEHTLHITLSIGVALISGKQNSMNDVLKQADIAMYRAKQLGRDTTCFFEDSMSKEIEEQMRINYELREAIKYNQFELYYQPIVEINSSKIVSCEALIRWNHPTRGLLYPDKFIQYAEESGLIIKIGEWVIEKVCSDYKELKEYIQNIAINISAKQFNQQNFIENILKITTLYGVPPHSLELELTESVVINNFLITIEKMNQLKSYGFTIAMDDFGTGYSSLSYLKDLPFDFLKIDRSFIQNILTNKDDASLVQTILAISKQFNFAVIAEGVESREHIEFLDSFGCNYIQGYVISKALPIESFKRLCKEAKEI